MKYWAISAGDRSWAVELNIRDPGGHLDITRRSRAGAFLQERLKPPTRFTWLAPYLLRSSVWLGSLAKYLPAGLHGSEGPLVSIKNLDSFRSSIVSACRLRKLPMANPHAVLSLLDAPDGCDPAYLVIWRRFKQMMRYLGYRPSEIPRIYRLLDFAAAGGPGHGPDHLLVESAGELGSAWDSAEEGWLNPGLLPLRMLAGRYQHLKSGRF